MDPSEGSEPVEMRSERDPADPPTDSVVEIVCVSPSSPASSSGLSLGKVVPRKKQKTNIKGRSVVPCSFCCVTFSNNTNLNKHIRAFHPGFVKCDICDQSVLTDVEQHLKQAHSLTLKHSKLIFNNEIDFQLWKVEEEKRTGSQYVSTSGTKKTPACVAKRYFICRRSGKFQSHSKLPPQSQKKPRGSIRCGVKCPARITLTVDHSGSYLVDYQEVHYGHERDTQGNQVVGRSQIKRLQSRHTQRLDSKSQSVAQQRQQPADRNSSEDPLKNSVSAKTPTPEAAIQPAVKLHYLESLWDLRNSEQFRNLGERLHMYFDRKSAVVLVSEVGVVMSGTMRPCLLSSLLFYEARPPSIYVRGVELLPETFQVGDIESEAGFFGLLCAVLNAPKCPGAADQADVFFDNVNGYVDTTCRWRHENCPIFSSSGHLCDGCESLRRLHQGARQRVYGAVEKTAHSNACRVREVEEGETLKRNC